MSPLDGVTTIKADITHPSTIPLLLRALDPDTYDPSSSSAAHPVDLVLSDGAPDVTGLHDLDVYIQSQLLWAALNLALCVLRPGGTFVAKIFRAKDVDLLYAQMRVVFGNVCVAKPRSSRASSFEAFIVCRDFAPPPGFKASLANPLGRGTGLVAQKKEVDGGEEAISEAEGSEAAASQARKVVREDGVVKMLLEEDDTDTRWIAPFLACGDLSSWDSDATYQLPKDRVTLDPVQPPTAPPYKRAIEMRRAAGGAYGKTKGVLNSDG
jgi:tRNA (cytidine32/guanosine34-2'-O)-methyltransferase